MITSFFNLLVSPFGQNHTWALVALSLLTGVIMAFVFKWTSNPRAIRAAKDRIKGRILEMRIYQDDPAIILKAFGGTLVSNARYLGAILVPFIALIIPVMIIFMQLDERYARRPLGETQQTVLSVELKDGIDPYETPVDLSTSGGVEAATKPVRVSKENEIDWRLRVAAPGTHDVTLTSGDESYTFPVVAKGDYKMIGHTRSQGWIEPLLHPAFPTIPDGSPISRISIDYPSASYPFLFWNVHWIAIFAIYSALAAIILKFVIKFEI